MQIQRLRNLTTGKLHTEISHVYEDLEWIIGETGLMTHMLPRVAKAVKPWLQNRIDDPRFWNEEYDPTHEGEFRLSPPTEEDRAEMLKRFTAMPDPLEGKPVIILSCPNFDDAITEISKARDILKSK